MENSVTARVRLLIDVPVNSSWSQSTTMAQITKQAQEDAIALVKGHFDKQDRGRHCISIIGEPVVTAVLATGTTKDNQP